MDFSNLEGYVRRTGNSCFVIDSSLSYELEILKVYVYNIKHEVLKELIRNNVNKNDLLDYILFQIEPITILQEHNELLIKNFLNEYSNVSIQDILNNEINNHNFKFLLNTNYKKIPKSYHNSEIAHSLQIAFYEHFSRYLEIYLVDFLKNKKTISSVNTIDDNNVKLELELNLIFKSTETLKIFKFLLDKFGINLQTASKRGVQAKLSGIWSCPSSKSIIFREHTEFKDYVQYLNNIFELKYN